MGRPIGNRRLGRKAISLSNAQIEGIIDLVVSRVVSEEAMEQAVNIIAEDAYERTPIDTGDLRKSQQTEVSRFPGMVVGEISYNKNGQAPYAGFVHEMAELHHPVGEYKFLEKAMRAKFDDAMRRYAAVTKSSKVVR